MAKAAFNKKKNLFTNTLDLNLRKKLVADIVTLKYPVVFGGQILALLELLTTHFKLKHHCGYVTCSICNKLS
jgi:hypothetical protein